MELGKADLAIPHRKRELARVGTSTQSEGLQSKALLSVLDENSRIIFYLKSAVTKTEIIRF